MDYTPLLLNFLPNLPQSWQGMFLLVGAIIGTIMLVYAVFIEQEHRQDLIRMLGAGGLLVYAVFIEDIFFIIAMGAVALASLVEFIEILTGLHRHGREDLKKYKKLWRVKK